MISPLTLITLLLAASAGLWLYHAKHRAELLDRQIARTLGQVAAARERIGVQRAEWALLNEPSRLGTITRQHLNLRPLATSQYVTVPDLGSRLPAYPELSASPWPISASVQGVGVSRDGHAASRERPPGMVRASRLHHGRVTFAGHVHARGRISVAGLMAP